MIELNVEGSQPPREEEERLVFEIPPSGQLAIPDEPKYGWARDEYFYVSEPGTLKELPQTGWGEGGMIWGKGNGSYLEEGRPELAFEHFFVGSEEDFKRAPAVVDLFKTLAVERQPL